MRDERNRRQRMKQVRKRRIKFRLLGAVILCLLAIAGARIVYAMNENRTAEITIKADEQSILQDEELPQYTVSAVCDEKQQKIVLDKESKYTVASLLKDLDSEKDISIVCNADNTKEGKYPIKISLSEELTKRLKTDWKDKVNIKPELFTEQNLN